MSAAIPTIGVPGAPGGGVGGAGVGKAPRQHDRRCQGGLARCRGRSSSGCGGRGRPPPPHLRCAGGPPCRGVWLRGAPAGRPAGSWGAISAAKAIVRPAFSAAFSCGTLEFLLPWLAASPVAPALQAAAAAATVQGRATRRRKRLEPPEVLGTAGVAGACGSQKKVVNGGTYPPLPPPQVCRPRARPSAAEFGRTRAHGGGEVRRPVEVCPTGALPIAGAFLWAWSRLPLALIPRNCPSWTA